MELSNPRNEENLRLVFSPLLKVNDHSKLADLVTPSDQEPSNFLDQISLLIKETFYQINDPNISIYTELSQKAHEWEKALKTALTFSALNIGSFPALQVLAQELIHGAKTAILRAQIQAGTQEADELESALCRIDTLVRQILVKRFHDYQPILALQSPYFRHTGIGSISFSLRQSSAAQEEVFRLRQITHLFSKTVPAISPHWKQNLITHFSQLNTEHEIKAAASALNSMQAGHLFSFFLKHKDSQQQLALIFCHLPWETLAPLMYEMSPQAHEQLLKALEPNSILTHKWSHDRWCQLSRQVSISCRQHGELCHFALGMILDKELAEIDTSLKEDVLNLRSTLSIYHLSAQNLLKLMEAKKAEASSIALIEKCCDSYTSMLELLGEDITDLGLMGKILETTCFEGLDDEDAAYEALGAWAIFSLKDYKECGLLPYVEEKDFDEGVHQPGYFFQQGVDYLASLQIKTVKDLKEQRIYGKHMLTAYLNARQNQYSDNFST